MSTIEDLLANQNQVFEAMQQLLRNFKKDPAERKTPPYIKKRLELLESYWSEFQANHVELRAFEDHNYTYFSENCYQKTKIFYNEARTTIVQQSKISEQQIKERSTLKTKLNEPEVSGEPSTSQQQLSNIHKSTTETVSQGNASKAEEMLRRQRSNFKAFSRTLAAIDLEEINEKWEYDDTLKNIESRWKTIDSLHWEIDSEAIGEQEEYETLFEKYERQYNSMKKALNTKMWSASHKEKSTPVMELPVFSGAYQHWTSFKDLFTETIHSNPMLSKAQKMQFLKSKVKGEAEKLIQHLSISSDNYNVCWEILNNRYNNKKLIFSSHLNTMLSLPTIPYQTAISIKRVHDTTNECLNAIKNLSVDISTWDPILVHLLSQKLDTDTYNDYIESLKQPRELPSLTEFLQFLEIKFTSLESSRRKQERPTTDQQQRGLSNNKFQPIYKAFSANQNLTSKPKTFNNSTYNNYSTLNKTTANNIPIYVRCPLCKNEHGLFHCNEFIKLHLYDRRKLIAKHNLCRNCLFDHKGNQCISEKRCKQCNEQHHTLLHQDITVNTTPKNNMNKSNNQNATTSSSHASMENISETLLATAQVKVKANDGSEVVLRALIDQGSQVSLITENAAQILELPRQKCKGVIFGVGARENNCKGTVTITCTSMLGNHTFDSEVYVMRHLINNLPNRSFAKPSTWTHLEGLQLADSDFNISRPVDILFGADIYSNIILGGIIKGEETHPIAQQSLLGWILCGNMRSYQCNVILNNLDEICRFWTIEDIAESSQMSAEDLNCIQQYQTTTKRQEDGRYVVRLPLHSDIKERLGESRKKAAAQFRQLENKFKKFEDIEKDYKLFINEYQELKHMRPCEGNPKPGYYLPHHCVQRPDSSTTALRVVFNASAKTTSGESLNDLMYRGPNLQTDLQSIILKWRLYRIALTADIEKMFRQVVLNEEDQKYQKILWRSSPDQHIKEYALTTVTYGTKAAPFLAMMTIRQLANDERQNYADAAAIIETSFYMDDLLYTSDDLETAIRIKDDLKNLLLSGGFNLRKWSSNNHKLLDENPINNKQEAFHFRHQESTKTLGLRWNPKEDNFNFQITIDTNSTKRVTKRLLLSEVSKIFDPLGWLCPVTTKLKLIFQQVWQENLRWDDEITENIKKEWIIIKDQLIEINELQIPRWLQVKKQDKIELHGFCDSSEKAYACVIYCKADQNSTVMVAAKSRLVPSKKIVSLPRFELCAALLLATLMKKVQECIPNHNITLYGWSDSTAVLGWLHGDHGRWKTFVSNKVKKIVATMPSNRWHYVKSAENPADCASRGINPMQLKEHQLWWHGPRWLQTFQPGTENNKINYETNKEIKINKQLHTNVTTKRHRSDVIDDILTRNSCLGQVTRVVAWILRTASHYKPHYLTIRELIKSRNIIIKHIQLTAFEDEISNLEQKKEIDRKSRLLPLNPYLDQDGLLRVGGRIRNANIQEDQKHPIIIPQEGHYTNLLIDQAHLITFHGGARLTTANIRKQYWIIGGIRAVKKRLHDCVICRKQNPIKQLQLMGDLPAARCNPTRPFHHTGVDYTGYVDVKANKGRGVKTTKGYVAVFVCMVTKAVHLEMVSDLSSSSFLSALRRLAARRGAPRHMYSDNGTNFVGANKVLKQEFINLNELLDPKFFTAITDMKIEWHFNAPSWPSAGGLWEAAVKSLKYHLRRVIGEQKLTFEEHSTLLTQLEACLNSRPLLPLNEDPDDFDYLTPSHFLSSGPTLTIIETETDERTRWQLVQRIYKDIWKRWQSEYLSQLSPRSKWRQARENMNINDVVIIHEANLPAGKWALGRVIELHPGNDGYVRVVTIKTKNGIMKRPITKLSILPIAKPENKEKEVPINRNNQQSEQKQQTNKPTNQKTNKGLCNLIWAILSVLTIVTPVKCNYSLTNINSSQTLYFDKITDMHIMRDEWKLIVFYDMDPYWHGIQTFKHYIANLEGICATSKERHCDVILLQLRHGYTELNYYSDMLLSQQVKNLRRRRRGLINGVGSIANSLFGVLDQQFADNYEKDIRLIKENEKHLVQLWKNQTSLVEGENNLLKRVEQTIDRQHKMYNQHIVELDKAANTMATEIKDMKTLSDFTLTSIIANNILENLKGIQETLLDTVTEIHYGKFNIHLLSPEQLAKELNIISGHLSSELTLPIENIQTDLRTLYHLLRVKARMTLTYFIFEIKIPLITRDSYEIYNLKAIPQETEEHIMVQIKPLADHIAINLKKDAYILLSQTELRSCIPYNYKTLMCSLQQPIYHLKPDENLCKKKMDTDQCETSHTICTDMWTQLNKINTYLFFCCGKRTIRIICEHQVAAERVSRAGVIALGEGCVIKGDTFTIYSHTQQSNTMSVRSPVLKVDIHPINNIFNTSIPLIQLKGINDSEYETYGKEFDAIDKRVQQMKSNEVSELITDSITIHDVHQYVVLYILAGVTLIAAGTYMWRRGRARCSAAISSTARGDQPPTEPPIPLTQRPQASRLTRLPNETTAMESNAGPAQLYGRLNKSTSPVIRKLFSESDSA